MRDFSTQLEITKDILKKNLNETEIDKISNLMIIEYEKLIPEIPYLGGLKNPFSILMSDGIVSLAMFRILENEGFTLREIGEFYYEFHSIITRIRKANLEKIGKDPANTPYEPIYVDFAKKMFKTPNLPDYPDDWVGEYVEGDGKTFVWGFNFYECGIHKVCKRLDGERFVPFFCSEDFCEAKILGYGFSRTKTLAWGASMCDHRYVRNLDTPDGWPPDDLPEFNTDRLPKE